MKKAFSIIEILIVVAILGIIAAIVVPQFQDQTVNAKSAVAKDNLMILRGVIELYTVHHNGKPPGYSGVNLIDGLMIPNQLILYTNITGSYSTTKTGDFRFGPYLKKMPVNTFNNKTVIRCLGDNEDFPYPPNGTYGWIYKPATSDIRIDWYGTDREGVEFYDY
ncbi:MAG: prepilin-type N-terminal cleavage/methylation domain-containing protein [Planctomycetota bacterium]|jgi:general secretion pathway protein G